MREIIKCKSKFVEKGATLARPATSGGEENLLCTPGDRYKGECIFLHELSHTIQEYGMSAIDSTFTQRLEQTYNSALRKGLWKETYAATNYLEYWAEGSQAYFDCNAVASPANGIHNEIGSKIFFSLHD